MLFFLFKIYGKQLSCHNITVRHAQKLYLHTGVSYSSSKGRQRISTEIYMENAINKSIAGSSTPYNAASILGKSVSKAERALPLSLRKRTTVMKKLIMNFGISLQNPLAKKNKKQLTYK